MNLIELPVGEREVPFYTDFPLTTALCADIQKHIISIEHELPPQSVTQVPTPALPYDGSEKWSSRAHVFRTHSDEVTS
jgi:hypothetical protein